MRILILPAILLVAMGSPVAGAQEEQPRVEYKPFQGLALDRDDDGGPPAVFRFELVPDSGFVVEALGPVEIDRRPDPLGNVPFPDVEPKESMLIPPGIFLLMAGRVEDATTRIDPPNRFGFSVQDGRFRLMLDKGVPLLSLGLLLLGAASVAGALVATFFLLRERRRKVEHLRLQRRQAEAREAERARLAREIHDGPLQDLHALRAALVTHSGDGAPSINSGLPTLDDGIGGVAHELRAIAEGLRPPALGRFGLAAALGAHATRFREQNPHVDIRLTLDDDGGPRGSRLSEPARATLFRIVQEAMSNAVQHGGAQTIEIRFALRPSLDAPREVVLEVCDDGTGLGGGVDLDALVADGHFGLVGMHERAALLDGDLTLGPAPTLTSNTGGHAGTAVRLTAPWESVTEHVAA